MSTGGIIAIVAGVAIFGVVAYLIVKQVDNTSVFGDITSLAGLL